MALTEQITLDIQDAERQIRQLETQLDGLTTPINVPVDVSGEGDLSRVRSELGLSERAADDLNTELRQADDALRDAGQAARRAGDDIERAGRRGSGAFSTLSGSVLALGGALGAIAVGRAFFDFATDAIGVAADLEEATSRVEVVFGELSDEIQDFADTAPNALGLSSLAALDAAGNFGNLLTALGLTQAAAADLTPDIITLAGDLASFNNLEVTDALDALRSGLVGEAEPLRRFGIAIDAAATQAKALELGLVGSNGELSEAAEIQARYALILEQTSNAQGDFARTSDSVTNKQKILAAQFNDVRAAVGEALLPAFDALLDVAPELIDIVERGLVPAFQTLGSAIETASQSGGTQLATTILGNLPIAGERIVDTLGSAGQAAGNFSQVITSLFTGQADDAVRNFRQGLEDLSDISISNTTAQSIQDLITTIAGGVEPVAALESVLAGLADADLPLEDFDALAERLATISGLDADDAAGLFRLIEDISTFGPQLGFTNDELETLRRVLLDLARGGIDPADIALRNLATTTRDLPPDIDLLADSLANVNFDVGVGRLPVELQSVATSLGIVDAAASGVDLSGIIQGFADSDRLAGDAAAAVDEYRLAILALTDPAVGLLRAQDDLAAAQAAYNEVVSDPDATPDDVIRATADLATAQGDLLAANQALPDDLGLTITALSELAEQAGADQEAIDLLIEALETLNGSTANAQVVLDIVTGALPDLSQGIQVPGLNVPAGIFTGEAPTPGAITVNNTFTSPLTPTTEAARAAQATNSLIATVN